MRRHEKLIWVIRDSMVDRGYLGRDRQEKDRDDKDIVVLFLASPVYGVLDVASFNFANHCVFP